MAELLASTWKVTRGGIILLDVTDLLTREPEIRGRCEADVARPIRSLYAVPLRAYNEMVEMPISLVRLFSSASLARSAQLTLLATGFAGVAVETQIYDQLTAQTYLFENTLINDFRATSDSERLHVEFTLTGGLIVPASGTVDTGGGGTGTGSAFAGFFNAYLANLPTVDPHVAGQPWNNGGILGISLG